MATLYCTVATPARELFSGEVYSVQVPGSDGSYGVLPGHEMLVATNELGGILTLNLDADGKDQKQFILYEGATQVFKDSVTVLGRFCKRVEDIDVDYLHKRQEFMHQHIEELSKGTPSKQDQAEIETSNVRLEWYQMQIDYAQKGDAVSQ